MHTEQEHKTHQIDQMDPARATAMWATLGQSHRVDIGDPLPAFFHLAYFWAPHPPSGLGRDGHLKVGGLIPDMGLPRRMWAAGRLEFHAPLIAGVPATKISQCESQSKKTGRSGPLGFVTIRHDFHQNDAHCLTEWHHLVYRADPDPADPKPVPPRAPTDEETCTRVDFDTTLLFRYSALMFNGHRIHYDLDYAKSVEGYDGLIVHGPLQAQLLIQKAEAELGPLKAFEFRATSPLVHSETAEFCRKGAQLWVRGPDGRQCMTATAEPA